MIARRGEATAPAMLSQNILQKVFVDVLIPVHNASATIMETVESVMAQRVPAHLQDFFSERPLDVAVCCYNDGSSDDSWTKLQALEMKYKDDEVNRTSKNDFISTVLLIDSSDTEPRGAPSARNRAARMRSKQPSDHHVCVWLDSDDTMHEHRIPEQVSYLYQSPDRDRLLLGSRFDRDPPDSTWHYAQWANGLSQERLMLERYREVTVLQPTWCMMRSRFERLGGYVEGAEAAVSAKNDDDDDDDLPPVDDQGILRLIHPKHDTPQTLRLAEDVRFLHAHLHADGTLDVVPQTLVTYRHRAGQSQSAQTPRKLLLQLRALAFEVGVLRRESWGKFVVWGAGRDGKDFVKALSEKARKNVICMVDVDHKKIETGHYINKDMGIRIPIVHFSLLARDSSQQEELQETYFSQADNEVGRISKQRPHPSSKADLKSTGSPPPRKKFRLCAVSDLDISALPDLPVVVCVAMYRTNGVLEKNVSGIGRREGHDLWHFS